jgi:hypothetical protein
MKTDPLHPLWLPALSQRRHARCLFLSFVLEWKYSLYHNAFTSLMMVLFYQNHTIRLIAQAQRGFLFF